MKRDNNYRTKSLKELLVIYAYETNRENREDAEKTQSKVVNEVYARIKDTFDFLDQSGEAEVDQIYKQLIEH